MTTRRISDAEWNSFKGAIIELYIDNDKSLVEVMTAMNLRGFRKTYVTQPRIGDVFIDIS
jgi:hypothetical protein